jgi:hypothetical protein
MYTLTLEFSAKQVRASLFAMLFESFRVRLAIAVAASAGLVALLLKSISLIDASAFLSAMIGISWGAIGGVVFFGVMYWINLMTVERTLKTFTSMKVAYQLSTAGCTVSSDGWSGVLQWTSFARLIKYSQVLLLEIADHRSTKEMRAALRKALRSAPGATAAVQSQTKAFPVFSTLPVPLRAFLAVPAVDLRDEHVQFIKSMLKSAKPGSSKGP